MKRDRIEYMREWRAKNIEKVRETGRCWAKNHRKQINERVHRHHVLNREKVNAKARAAYAANPKKFIERTNRWQVKHADEIGTKRQTYFEGIAGRPASPLCEICGEPNQSGRSRRMNFDHDHFTGEFRGWICWRCNSVLGKVCDDIELLDKMIVYLTRSRRPKLVSTRST